MNFSNLSSEQRIRILLQLIGGPQYTAQMKAAAAQTGSLAKQTQIAGDRALAASRKTFLWGQALFTLRRYAFYATLGITVMIAEVIRLGFTYTSTMQKATTSLRPFFGSNGELKRNMNALFFLAAQTPFQFQEVTKSFATLFEAFQPLGITAKTTRDTIVAVSNALVVGQRFTPAAINRVTLALQHMAYQGRLTGRMVNQLGQDGIPIFDILNKKLGLTGLNLTQISRLGIPTATILQAINSYLLNDPKFKNQAYKSQTKTLVGAFSTFKDFLSQAAGGSTGGIFGFAQKFFKNIDDALRPAAARDKPITMNQLVGGIDQALTPKTHGIIVLFQFLTGVVRGFAFAVSGAILVVTTLLRPLDALTNLFGGGSGKGGAAKILGYAFGMLFFVAVIRKTITAVKMLTAALRIEMATEVAAMLVRKKAALFMLFSSSGWNKVLRGLEVGLLGKSTMFLALSRTFRQAGFIAALQMFVSIMKTAIKLRYAAIVQGLVAIRTAIMGLTIATIGWVTVLTAAVAALALIIIYRKQLFGSHDTPASPPKNISPNKPSWWARNFAWASRVGTVLPAFADGGIVQGFRGSPQMIMAHGGETVLPTHKGNMQDWFSPVLHTTINLDGKKIADVVSKHKADKNADR